METKRTKKIYAYFDGGIFFFTILLVNTFSNEW